MNAATTNSNPGSAAESIDLMPYINALIDARWWLLAAAMCCGMLTALWAYSKPYLYEAGAKVSVVDITDPGGVSPDDRRASQVLTLVEHGFVMGTTRDNYNEVMLARLVSRDFTMRFLDKFNIYRHFYPQQWNEQKQRWRDGFSPDRGESFTRFRDEVRIVDHDELTEIISVKMRWPQPTVARDWANLYVTAFNDFIREKTLHEVRRKQTFLEEELMRSDILEIQQSIYRLIEAQTAISMLASAREEYALEIIDPAAVPYKSFNMSRKRKVLLGTIVGAMLACFLVLALVLARSLLRTLLEFRAIESSEKMLDQIPTDNQHGDH